MPKPTLTFATGLIRLWVAAYTVGLRSEDRRERFAEIESDIWEYSSDATDKGAAPVTTSAHMLLRLFLGIPMDLSWRLGYRGAEHRLIADYSRKGFRYALAPFRMPKLAKVVTLSIIAIFSTAGAYALTNGSPIFDASPSTPGLPKLASNNLGSNLLADLASIVPSIAIKMSTPEGDTATLLDDGRVLVIGDFASPQNWSGAELYDPRKDSWSSTAYLADKRRWHAVSVLPSGDVIATGGLQRDGSILHTAELFDPHTNMWQSIAAMHFPRAYHTATVLADGRLLIVGGVSKNLHALSTAEIYDPVTKVWTIIDSLDKPRILHAASLMHDGRVLVSGGADAATRFTSPYQGAEIYSPATDTWTKGAEMASNRSGHSSTLLQDGRILIVGGNDEKSNLASAELYDPDSDYWAEAGIIASARTDHGASLMSDGRVIIGGGVTELGDVSKLAEIYDPRVDTWLALSISR
tara:strand:- start:1136 stop:2533 length:1398 start_codon:yes stop_codon:yes gene_type:complete